MYTTEIHAHIYSTNLQLGDPDSGTTYTHICNTCKTQRQIFMYYTTNTNTITNR